jgi:hypothetical protein
MFITKKNISKNVVIIYTVNFKSLSHKQFSKKGSEQEIYPSNSFNFQFLISLLDYNISPEEEEAVKDNFTNFSKVPESLLI